MTDAPAPKVVKTVHSLTRFVDNNGRTVEMRQQIDKDSGLMAFGVPATFHALVQGELGTPNGVMPVPMAIIIPAATIYEAFEKFSEVVDVEAPKRINAIKERMERDFRAMQLAQGARIGMPPG